MQRKPFAVAIGASAGGVEALLELAAALPHKFPAIVLVVQHIGANRSVLPQLLRARGANPAVHPQDGDRPLPGTIYVAPPDLHLLVEHDRIRLVRGPKENHCRPAVDPLFRSVALNFRERAIGVVLTGHLDDGTAGLRAIKRCGGLAIVQDPATATEPSMPQAALDNVDVDLSLTLQEIVPALVKLVAVAPAAPQRQPAPETVRREHQIIQGEQAMENLKAIAAPSSLTCPDCGGTLWEMNDERPLRYRCHTGHAFSSMSLENSQVESAEYALWSGVRALHEREMLLRRVSMVSRAHRDEIQAIAGEAQADRLREQRELLEKMVQERTDGA